MKVKGTKGDPTMAVKWTPRQPSKCGGTKDLQGHFHLISQGRFYCQTFIEVRLWDQGMDDACRAGDLKHPDNKNYYTTPGGGSTASRRGGVEAKPQPKDFSLKIISIMALRKRGQCRQLHLAQEPLPQNGGSLVMQMRLGDIPH